MKIHKFSGRKLRRVKSREDPFKRTYLCSPKEKEKIYFIFNKPSDPKLTGLINIIDFETAMNNQKIEFLTPTEERLTAENKYLKIQNKVLEDAVSYWKSAVNESRESNCSRKYCNNRRF